MILHVVILSKSASADAPKDLLVRPAGRIRKNPNRDILRLTALAQDDNGGLNHDVAWMSA
jgi:hypothetical protein